MGTPWEENPEFQKAQAYLAMGLLFVFTAIGAVLWAVTGDWHMFALCVLIFIGLWLSWALAALALIGVLKLLSRNDKRKSSESADRQDCD